jgi:hypothetical protein
MTEFENARMIMMSNKMTVGKNGVKIALAGAAIAWICWTIGSVCQAQTAPADFTPTLQHVVNLSKGGMSDDFILTYITNSGTAFNLSDDDIIYLHKQGVSDGVIKALMQTAAPASANPPAAAPPAGANFGTTSTSPTPPPLDAGPGPAPANPEPAVPAAPAPVAAPAMPPPAAPPLQDIFYTDPGLNAGLWTTQSPILSALAASAGAQVYPALGFSPSGMQMSGVGGPGQWMGIQSTTAFVPPFTFSTTVSGLTPEATPFEIYLVSADLQQWVSIAGHLGGHGHPHNDVVFHFIGGGAAVPVGGGSSPDYGVWINHTGSGLPIAALGYKLADHPLPGRAYTVQISAGADGAASVAFVDAAGVVMGTQTVPVGTGPFYVVLAGRGGRTIAEWQSVQLTPAAPPVVVQAAPQPPTPTLDYFQSQLAPYGAWVTVPGYGLCWQPSVDPGWRPYYDGGYWTDSDQGWYWQSDYPWGDIAFHYGRWAYTVGGWVWVPGYDYAPSWVVWRHADADGYVGWAPLPPGAVFVDGGWMFHGAHVGVDFDFGLGAGFFTFVGYDHFADRDYRRFVVPHDRLVVIYRHSTLENHYRVDHGRFVNEGVNRERMAALTHHDFHPVAAQELRHQEEQRNVEARNDDLHSFKAGNTKPNAMRTVSPSQHAPVHSSSQPQSHSSNQGGGGNQQKQNQQNH